MTAVSADPASRAASSWAATLAAWKSRGVPDDDPRVIECRQALAYHRVSKTIATETPNLSPAGIDLLITQLKEAASP